VVFLGGISIGGLGGNITYKHLYKNVQNLYDFLTNMLLNLNFPFFWSGADSFARFLTPRPFHSSWYCLACTVRIRTRKMLNRSTRQDLYDEKMK